MKSIVIYYSRTGITKKAAEAIISLLKADNEEIAEKIKRKGLFGYLRSGREAVLRLKPAINKIQSDLTLYDMVIIGTPVWAGNMASPVRTFLSHNKDKIKHYAVFCTHGDPTPQKTFLEIENLMGRKPIHVLSLQRSEIKNNEFTNKITSFVKSLQ